MKKSVCRISLTFLMLLFILGFAGGPVSAQARFTDVAADHWAAKHIVKMDLRRVVEGYPDGTFRPDNTVNQAEALKMAVHSAGLQSQVELANELLYLPFDVPDWARKEAIVAVKEGFIVPEENRFTADQPAQRAWVAQLVVRMIGKENEAIAAANSNLNFTDAGQIPKWARGHVAVAVKYGLVRGYTDNTFKPLNNVTRAEMTAFLCRAEEHLSIPGLINGTITDLSSTSVTLTDANGQAKKYSLVYPFHLYDQKGEINLQSLQRYSRVSMLVEGDRARYIEVLEEDTAVRSLRGEIVQVYPEENALVLKDGEQLKSIIIAPNALVTLYGGNAGSCNDLASGDVIEVRLDEFNQGVAVTVIESTGGAGNEGIVYDIDHELNLLVLKSNNKLFPYQFDDDVFVEISNQRFASIDDIREGDMVKITVSNGLIQTINLLGTGVELASGGTVVQVSAGDRILTLRKDDGSLEAYEVEGNAEITISGMASAALSDIIAGDLVEIEVKDGKITAVEVKNREVDSMVKGTVVGVDTSNLVITIKNEAGELKAYEINEAAEYFIDDDEVALEDLEKDMKVEIQLVQGKVIYLESRNTIEGTVEQISESRKILVLNELGGETQTLILDSDVDVNIEDESADLDDIQKGDFVEVRIEDGKVKDINVQKILTYIVTDVYKSSNRLKVEDEDEDSKNLYIRSYVDLIVQGKDKPKIEDVNEGDIVKATYMGNRLRRVEVMPVLSGKITAVNTYSNLVTVQLFEGTSQNVPFNDESKIIIDGKSYYHLSELAAGDRVQVRDNIEGGKVYYIMEKASGQFYSVNEDRDKIYIQRNPVEWDNYNLHENVYLHQAGTSISFRDLEMYDLVDLYLLDDLVYEIEKL